MIFMNYSDKSYCKKFVNDSLNIFRRDGYLTDIEELKEYILLSISIEKSNKEFLLEYILELFLDSDKYQEFKNYKVKFCKQCERVLPESDFNKKEKGKSTRRYICKECSIKNNYKYRQRNKEKIKQINQKSNRKYYLKRFLQKKLNREVSNEELDIAFKYKDLNNIKENIKIYEKFFIT